jgi:hypothetical protein
MVTDHAWLIVRRRLRHRVGTLGPAAVRLSLRRRAKARCRRRERSFHRLISQKIIERSPDHLQFRQCSAGRVWLAAGAARLVACTASAASFEKRKRLLQQEGELRWGWVFALTVVVAIADVLLAIGADNGARTAGWPAAVTCLIGAAARLAFCSLDATKGAW